MSNTSNKFLIFSPTTSFVKQNLGGQAFQLSTSDKGVSLYLALMIMTILLALALGVSTILVSQIKMIREMGNSVIAFYAADTGIERAMYAINKEGVMKEVFDSWDGVSYKATPKSCDSNTCIKSVGTYKEIRRAIQVTLPGVSFPIIANVSVNPTSGPPGTIFTIKADISDTDGINATTTIAHIQLPDETDIDTVTLSLISGDEYAGTYQADWNSTGAPEGGYFIDIVACDTEGNCSELENLETLITS